MAANDDFEDLVNRIEPLSPNEQREILLGYFNGILNGMQASEVRALRAHYLTVFPPCPVQDMMIEILDGHHALREIHLGEPEKGGHAKRVMADVTFEFRHLRKSLPAQPLTNSGEDFESLLPLHFKKPPVAQRVAGGFDFCGSRRC
jgi:hypothetical protein